MQATCDETAMRQRSDREGWNEWITGWKVERGRKREESFGGGNLKPSCFLQGDSAGVDWLAGWRKRTEGEMIEGKNEERRRDRSDKGTTEDRMECDV